MQKRIGILVVVVVTASLAYWGYHSFFGNTPDMLEASGTIEATKVELRAKVAGTVDNFTIQPGQGVHKGQLVAEIVRNDLVAQRERDQLAALKAEAQLADLTSGARQQEIDEVAAAVNLAQAEYEKVSTDYIRAERLFSNRPWPRRNTATWKHS